MHVSMFFFNVFSQWANIILVVEQTVTTDERRCQQMNYSRPLDDGRRALMIRWHHSVSGGREQGK